MAISEHLRQVIISRAANRCEYCRISQVAQEAMFHIDHIIPQSPDGPTTLENLALACASCSLRKADRIAVTDPETGTEAPIFNPRRDEWRHHFSLEGLHIVGVTPSGRGTAAVLQFNRQHSIDVRAEEQARGRFPFA